MERVSKTPSSSRAKKFLIVGCFLIVLALIILQNSCVFTSFPATRRNGIFLRRFQLGSRDEAYYEDDVKVEEIPLDDVGSGFNGRVMTKVQLIPLWTTNDSMIKVCFISMLFFKLSKYLQDQCLWTSGLKRCIQSNNYFLGCFGCTSKVQISARTRLDISQQKAPKCTHNRS